MLKRSLMEVRTSSHALGSRSATVEVLTQKCFCSSIRCSLSALSSCSLTMQTIQTIRWQTCATGAGQTLAADGCGSAISQGIEGERTKCATHAMTPPRSCSLHKFIPHSMFFFFSFLLLHSTFGPLYPASLFSSILRPFHKMASESRCTEFSYTFSVPSPCSHFSSVLFDS